MCALAIDAEQALLEYLDMFYKLGRAGRALKRFGAIDFATTIAPGHPGRAADRQDVRGGAPPGPRTGRRVVRRGVMDAPPTGRITRFLNVNSEVAGLARVGPIRNQADAVMRVLHSRADRGAPGHAAGGDAGAGDRWTAIAELRAAGLPVGG